MDKTKVVNVRHEKYDVYIGRGSKWGNPFMIGRDGDRDRVIELYKIRILRHPELLQALQELEGKVLGCYCKPLACHGDVLVELIEKKIWITAKNAVRAIKIAVHSFEAGRKLGFQGFSRERCYEIAIEDLKEQKAEPEMIQAFITMKDASEKELEEKMKEVSDEEIEEQLDKKMEEYLDKKEE